MTSRGATFQPAAEGARYRPQLAKGQVVSGSFWTINGARVPASGMHHGVLTDAPTLTLWCSNESDIAFFTCQRITYLTFPGRSRYQLQLCLSSRTDLAMLSSRCSVLISTFVFDILQISSECCHVCSGCIALIYNHPPPPSVAPDLCIRH
jgi:hypothetical protein